MAAYLGRAGVHALAVASGTAALHLVLRAAGVSVGDRVAVSTLTFAGSVWPILYLGAVPVFLDSEPLSGNLCPALVREYLADAAREGQLPKVLVAVHLYGQHADVDAIAQACREHGVTLVEDAAESLGATYRGRQTATTADYSILSFNGNKIITTTGGGMVVAKDPGRDRPHEEVGESVSRAGDRVRARGARIQLPDEQRARRHRPRAAAVLPSASRRVARCSRATSTRSADLPGRELPGGGPWGTHSRWLTVMYLDATQAAVRPTSSWTRWPPRTSRCDRCGVPMHTQPMFAGAARVGGEVAERLYGTGVCLPSSSSLSEADQARVCALVRTALLAPASVGP
jgi:dTDP-4-amino-4,6-dideoxygalactose transaminase